MYKKSVKITGWVLLMLFLALLMVGCGAATLTTAKSELTPNQAAELIYHDLTFHGVGVEKVNVTSCVFKDRNTTVVDATYTTEDGKNISQKVTLVRENGQWLIPDHDH
ncbi:hypothetical protein Desdi_1952 [Desulfitobacterium dichloroeliminans LMG P-21439]|uniref:DUF4878 domain-containing protein n=1 Tax=Desulfitobacterium dichloroeliminans (strain LMG P-21439 / DCA1) TaxID=871963 RepID=L0F8N3_DESDL|nr:hypothetical protein [Desulfitobacterium dichloroeliminans]AGA69400.1 hypothetical protein Desdi_1952 [Desulfitobacterium dichloroeliminans LMG P-21439]